MTATLAEAEAALAAADDGTPYLPLGPLASIVEGTVAALEPGDWWVPGLRERAGAVLRDVPLDRVGADALLPYGIAPAGTSPALRALHAVGLALAGDDPAVVHLGTGSVADGAFAEALNLAALRSARVVFVVAWMDLSRAPVPEQSAAPPGKLAGAYGVSSTTVDGSDAKAVRKAVAKARKAKGPTVIVATLG